MVQREITERVRLLDGGGNVALPGWCRYNMYDYDRTAIKAPASRIKEWDFYQITNERYTVQMTIANVSFGGAGCFTLFDRATGKKYEQLCPSLLTFGRYDMPSVCMAPHVLRRKGPGFDMSFTVTSDRRILSFEGSCGAGNIKADLEYSMMPGLQSLTMAVPFAQKGHFYLNQKVNCMPVNGSVRVGGLEVNFDSASAFGLLDWGRGVWPYRCSWYWGNGAARLPDGKIFGFELGWGFGKMDDFTENTLFYDGAANKIGVVSLTRDPADIMLPWHFTSDDGRLDMTMTPDYDNYTSSRVGLIGNVCHQVYGRWNGKAVLDDGTALDIHDMIAFCENSDNRW